MALKVNEIVKVEVEASDGQVLKEGDATHQGTRR